MRHSGLGSLCRWCSAPSLVSLRLGQSGARHDAIQIFPETSGCSTLHVENPATIVHVVEIHRLLRIGLPSIGPRLPARNSCPKAKSTKEFKSPFESVVDQIKDRRLVVIRLLLNLTAVEILRAGVSQSQLFLPRNKPNRKLRMRTQIGSFGFSRISRFHR